MDHPSDLVGTRLAIAQHHRHKKSQEKWFQVLALVTACMLSLGSHYGTYLLGPLKTSLNRELGSDNVQFSILIGSFSLNNTWTPLVGGILTARLGTAVSSILATGLILGGQAILLLGRWNGNLATMAWGCFLFGLGISPLAVVQETIICRFFDKKGLGISLALGLVAGKGASFLSSVVSLPLAQRFSPTAPFVVATCIAALSFLVNLFYLSANRWLAESAGVPQEGQETAEDFEIDEEAVSLDEAIPTETLAPSHGAKRVDVPEQPLLVHRVSLLDLSILGDPFWIYMTLNFLCGMIWYPFLHLAANLVQRRYQLSDSKAAKHASILLAGPLVLYPLVGSIVDAFSARPLISRERSDDASEDAAPTRPSAALEEQCDRDTAAHDSGRARIVHLLFIVSSVLTLVCFCWLLLPIEWTKTPVPGLVSWGIGHGFSTLLLVLVVPGIVTSRYIPLALGAHKSIEMAGSTLSSTIAGWLLDAHPKKQPESPPPTPTSTDPIPLDGGSTWNVFLGFLFANIVQLAVVLWLRRADIRRYKRGGGAGGAHGRFISQILPFTVSNQDVDQQNDELAVSEPLLGPSSSFSREMAPMGRRDGRFSSHHRSFSALVKRDTSAARRGRLCLFAYIGVVCLVWIIFAWTVAEKFSQK